MPKRVIMVGEDYDEATLKKLLPQESWRWWTMGGPETNSSFTKQRSLLVSKGEYQFSFRVDYRKRKPYYLRGLSKGHFGSWTSIADSMNSSQPVTIDLKTLTVVRKRKVAHIVEHVNK